MEQTDTERPATRPARERFEVTKHPFGVISALLGKHQNGDHEGNDTGECPENSGSLPVELTLRHLQKIIYIYKKKGVDEGQKNITSFWANFKRKIQGG